MAGTHPDRAGERLVDMAELVDRVKRSRRSIEKDVEAGRMPQPIRIGRSVRWRLTDIETWIANGCPPVSERRS